MRHHKSTKIHLELRKRSILSTPGNIPGLNVPKYVIFQLQLSSNLILASEQLFLEIIVQLYLNINIQAKILINSDFLVTVVTFNIPTSNSPQATTTRRCQTLLDVATSSKFRAPKFTNRCHAKSSNPGWSAIGHPGIIEVLNKVY